MALDIWLMFHLMNETDYDLDGKGYFEEYRNDVRYARYVRQFELNYARHLDNPISSVAMLPFYGCFRASENVFCLIYIMQVLKAMLKAPRSSGYTGRETAQAAVSAMEQHLQREGITAEEVDAVYALNSKYVEGIPTTIIAVYSGHMMSDELEEKLLKCQWDTLPPASWPEYAKAAFQHVVVMVDFQLTIVDIFHGRKPEEDETFMARLPSWKTAFSLPGP